MAEVDVERDEDAAMDDGAAPKRGGKGKGVKTKGRGHDAAKTDGELARFMRLPNRTADRP